jgi:hypothetical protein
MKITKSQLKSLIKEEVSRIQKRTVLEERKKEIEKELRILNEGIGDNYESFIRELKIVQQRKHKLFDIDIRQNSFNISIKDLDYIAPRDAEYNDMPEEKNLASITIYKNDYISKEDTINKIRDFLFGKGLKSYMENESWKEQDGEDDFEYDNTRDIRELFEENAKNLIELLEDPYYFEDMPGNYLKSPIKELGL